jgi:hypothetical protein
MSWFEIIVKRWKAKTPYFFRKLIKFGLLLITLSGALLGSEYLMHMPAWVPEVAGKMALVGITISTVAKFAVEDKKDIL